MRVKLTKCKTLVHPGRSVKVRPEGGGDPLFRVVEDCIGTEEYRRDTLSQLVEEMGRPLPALANTVSSVHKRMTKRRFTVTLQETKLEAMGPAE